MSAEGIERGARVGVPGGARVLRPEKIDLGVPLSAEEQVKFQRVLAGAPPAAPDGGGAKTALLADDDPQQRQLLAFSLERVGLAAHEVGDGDGALRALKARPYALLVLDLKLPGLDGFEVLRGARGALKLDALPICVLAGTSDPRDEVAALGLGADEFLIKPVSYERFAARVKALLRRSGGFPRREILA